MVAKYYDEIPRTFARADRSTSGVLVLCSVAWSVTTVIQAVTVDLMISYLPTNAYHVHENSSLLERRGNAGRMQRLEARLTPYRGRVSLGKTPKVLLYAR